MLTLNKIILQNSILASLSLIPIGINALTLPPQTISAPYLQLGVGLINDNNKNDINHAITTCENRFAQTNINSFNAAGLVELGYSWKTIFSNNILSYVAINAFYSKQSNFLNSESTTETVTNEDGEYNPGILTQDISFDHLYGFTMNLGKTYYTLDHDNYTVYLTLGWAAAKIKNNISWKFIDDPGNNSPNPLQTNSLSYNNNGLLWGGGFTGPIPFLNEIFDSKQFDFSVNINVINLKKKSFNARLPENKSIYYHETAHTSIITVWTGIIYHFW